MASRGKSRHGRGRGRSRKQRPTPGTVVVDAAVEIDRATAASPRATRTQASPHEKGGFRDPLSVGERPPAPWHPWPLSELLILVGAIGTIFGLRRLSHGGISNGGPVLFAGLGAVVLGTLEVTLREHRAGYRSHTWLLASIPVLVLDTALAFGVSALTRVPYNLLISGLLVVDVALFVLLFKLLHARFKDARARVISRR